MPREQKVKKDDNDNALDEKETKTVKSRGKKPAVKETKETIKKQTKKKWKANGS